MPRLHVGIEPDARVTVDVADDSCIMQSGLLRRVLDERSDPSGPLPVELSPEAFTAWLAGVGGAEDRYLTDLFGSIEVRSSPALQDAERARGNVRHSTESGWRFAHSSCAQIWLCGRH